MKFLKAYRHEILLFALLLQLVHPFFSLLFVSDQTIWHLTSFTILVIASFIMGTSRVSKTLVITFGCMGAISLWCGYLFAEGIVTYLRIYATCFFYITLIYILTRNFLISTAINLQVVIGAISGYLLIGYLGASTIEMMDFHHPGSFKLSESHDSFDYYYFSFISLVTVGYGDIVPLTAPAKSLTIFISIVGQLYMAIGIASFVGKFMNK